MQPKSKDIVLGEVKRGFEINVLYWDENKPCSLALPLNIIPQHNSCAALSAVLHRAKLQGAASRWGRILCGAVV